jgi:peptidoglycan DL-endopeptidase CwlO
MAARTAPLVLRSVDIRPQVEPVTPSVRLGLLRRSLLAAVAIVIGLVVVIANPGAASAEPDEEGMNALMTQLAEAQQAYLDAQARLDASVARQQGFVETLATADAKMATYQKAVGEIAHRAYISAGFTTVTAVLSTDSMEEFLNVWSIEDTLVTHEADQMRALRDAVAEANALHDSIDAEVAEQQAALQEMEKRKQEAEDALWWSGSSGQSLGFSSNASAVAEAAPRSADGTWAPEERTVWEENTGSYLTPRMAHARDEAYKAGFTYWTSCYYGGGSGQHPLGRACDFAVEECRFCGNAEGAALQYGTDLAAFFVFNAQRLGVLYVIWYRQIWMPSSGWRSYSGCCTSSEMHTNHVHLSVY